MGGSSAHLKPAQASILRLYYQIEEGLYIYLMTVMLFSKRKECHKTILPPTATLTNNFGILY
jgi:hypothetical protein